MADSRFKTGAFPSPRHKLLAAEPHRALVAPPSQAGFFPKLLSYWLNDVEGDCVTAEEGFAKACYLPEIFIPDQVLGAWASSHGWANGANLTDVMDAMQKQGFQVGNQLYNNGPYTGVDYTNEAVLQSAISQGPVKIAIAASCLPSGAGNQMGWYDLSAVNDTRTDHCVALNAYGTAEWFFDQLNAVYGNVPMPSGLPGATMGYGLYTWKTIGFVSIGWIKGTTTEAWLRNPTTVGVPPLPAPIPPIPPTPVVQYADAVSWATQGITEWQTDPLSKADAIAAAEAGLAANWPG